MNYGNRMMKRVILYITGMFFLSLGVAISIEANLGVSPVSSFAYALTLATGISVGIMTVAANVLYIVVQIILGKRFDFKDAAVQMTIAFIYGFFIDLTLFLIRMLLPSPETLLMRWVY